MEVLDGESHRAVDRVRSEYVAHRGAQYPQVRSKSRHVAVVDEGSTALPFAIGDLAVRVSHKWAFSYRLRLELARRAKTPHRAEDLLHPAVVLVFGCTLHDEALRALAMPRARCARPSYRSGTHGRLHLLATLVPPAADPVLEPPIRLVE